MSFIDLRGETLTRTGLTTRLPRAEIDVQTAVQQVRPVVDQVRTGGAAALVELAERFDGVRPSSLRVPTEVLTSALESLDPGVRAALEEAIRRTRVVHADQRRDEVTTVLGQGASVTHRWVPVSRVGLYVPGGLAVYPSSVVMNVVPAQTAGVPSIAIASPPQKEFGGLPHPTVLAAAALLGVEEVYAVGGAQAIAMFAYGVSADPASGLESDCEPVDLVTGPGNIFVAAAKRLLKGVIGIDAEAGPTEIAILADATADPRQLAYDLISQAEHDPCAASVLVTDSASLLGQVQEALVAAVAATKHHQRVVTALAGPQSALVLVDDLEAGIAVVDAYAAEHLEIQTENAAEVAAQVRNAGAIFVGRYSPVSLGDYLAGSNHVLPTGGSARHSSGLSVQTFLRGTQVITYSREALTEVAEGIYALSDAEDLPAHGDAVRSRLT